MFGDRNDEGKPRPMHNRTIYRRVFKPADDKLGIDMAPVQKETTDLTGVASWRFVAKQRGAAVWPSCAATSTRLRPRSKSRLA